MHSLVEEHFVFTNAIQVWSDEIKNHCMYSMLVSLTEYICNATRGAHVAYRYSTILVLYLCTETQALHNVFTTNPAQNRQNLFPPLNAPHVTGPFNSEATEPSPAQPLFGDNQTIRPSSSIASVTLLMDKFAVGTQCPHISAHSRWPWGNSPHTSHIQFIFSLLATVYPLFRLWKRKQ